MITIHTLVDNTAQRSSALWAEHGVSFAIETPGGWVLFDTGQSGDVLEHNAGEMKIPLDRFAALAISHAHYDHTGGLERYLTFARPGTPLYANPSLLQERYSVKGEAAKPIGLQLSKERLSDYLDLRLNAGPTEIVPGVWTTGEITDRSEFEGRSPNHRIREDGQWIPDPYRDDLSLVLDAADGLVVVCGCCHAGLLNTLKHIRETFDRRIQAVIGGMHLASITPETLKHAVDELGAYAAEGDLRLYPNHCTGETAYHALAQAFGERVQPCPAGSRLQFD